MTKRSFSRAIVNVDITIKSNDKIIHCMLENISMGGLFANTISSISLKENDTAVITIPLPVSYNKDCIVVTGIVTRINEKGVAFRFLETDMDTLRTLFSLVNINMAPVRQD
jgi:hypothetical protein